MLLVLLITFAHKDFWHVLEKKIKHHTLVANLLEAILIPSQFLTVKVAAHTAGSDPVTWKCTGWFCSQTSCHFLLHCTRCSFFATCQSNFCTFLQWCWGNAKPCCGNAKPHWCWCLYATKIGLVVNMQIDFVHLPSWQGYKHLLVIVDMFSKWLEAYPTGIEDAKTVVKCLLKRSDQDWDTAGN